MEGSSTIMARTTVRPIADADLRQRDQQVAQAAATTTIAELVFVPELNIPDARFAAVEVFPGKYMAAYKPEFYTRAEAAEVARIVIGPFVDRTDETAELVRARETR